VANFLGRDIHEIAASLTWPCTLPPGVTVVTPGSHKDEPDASHMCARIKFHTYDRLS
jgi:hypothetical protein